MRLPIGLLLLTLSCRAATFEEISALAEAARQSNDIPRAIELYGEAVKLNPKWQQGWWFLGTFHYGSGKFAPARDAYRHVVELNPRNAPGWGLLGLCEFQTAEYAKALDHIQQSLTLGSGKEPQIGEILRYHEAVLLAKSGRFDQAIEKFAPFLRTGPPPTPPLVTAFGVAVLRMPVVPAEVPSNRQDLVTAAGNAAALAMRGAPASEAAFQELLERFPREKNVHYIFGSHLLQFDQRRAKVEFQRELEITPNNAAAESMLALISSLDGDLISAVRYAEKAVKDDTVSPTGQYVLGRVLVASGQPERGIRYLEAAVRMDPSNVESHVELATAYPKIGRYQDAKKERFRTLELMKELDAKP